MDKKIKDKLFKVFIWLFALLYFSVASISCYHCVEFCMVGNPFILSVIMSGAFEIGLALTLFSVLVNDNAKNNIVSWVLMVLLTIVQVMGNVFSVEKYMETTNNGFYVYIQNGFLHWFTDDMPEKDIMSIIAIILGALLPFVALLMTSMVASNWKEHIREMKEIDNKTEEKTEKRNEISQTAVESEDTPKEIESNDSIENNDGDQEKHKEDVDELVETTNKEYEIQNQEETDSNEILDITPEVSVEDGSLLSPQEHEEMVRNTTDSTVIPKPNRPIINFFNPK